MSYHPRALALSSKALVTFFSQCQPEAKQEEKELEELVIKSPFQTTEEIFEDVIPTVNSNEFYAISFLGSQGHGKSYAASGFATLAENMGYHVIYGKAEDLLYDLESWIKEAKKRIQEHGDPRICIILDDLSYSTGTVSAKKAAAFKHFVADIRHVFEGVLGTIKLFMIYISHRYHSLPPMLRNSGSWIFASMLSEDRADAMKLIPRQKDERMKLERLYSFLSKVVKDGPKLINLVFTIGDSEFKFKWGIKEDPGDGRLMMSYHGGELRIFNAKKIEGMIDIDERRIKFVKAEELSDEEKEELIRLKAEELFPIPVKENTDIVEMEDIS